ncbi:unnamed protein product [Peronospora farinosa]|uniref:Uncharacterized protein n=1 Tax=Peronospora farinosa TaxID=134698 RepID=A0ABN8C541_9STRA|nr:unnamed protein product [Peronospora farinosa]
MVPRSSPLRDVPDVVLSYEITKLGYPNAGEHANALVTNESGKEIHVVENENDDARENDAVKENVVRRASLEQGSRRKRKYKKGARRSPRRRNARQKTDAFDSVVTESVCALEYVEGSPHRGRYIEVARPPSTAADITSLPDLACKDFLHELKAGDIEQVCIVSATEAASKEVLEARPKSARGTTSRHSLGMLFVLWATLYTISPVSTQIFSRRKFQLSFRRIVWPFPRDQVIAIDEFFEGRRKAGHVRESISPHSNLTFCVKKSTGGWRIVHAFNKLNDATIPSQTPIFRKDMVLNTMSGSEIYSAIDLTDGVYQILMRYSDIPFTAVSTPSGMLWEWLVMPQGLKKLQLRSIGW